MDEEWELIEPLMPAQDKIDRPRKWSMREVWDAVQHTAAASYRRAMLPKDFPPFMMVQYYFYRLRDRATLNIFNVTMVIASRLLVGRTAELTAGVRNGQRVNLKENDGPCGYHAREKIMERKRHILTGAQGNTLGEIIPTADVQGRDCAPDVVAGTKENFPTLAHLFANGDFAATSLKPQCRT